jgi:hypothetical protein
VINESDPKVKALYARALQSQKLVREWAERHDAAKADPSTTPEEMRELIKMGIDLGDSGLELALPFLDDEDFPDAVRQQVLKMMADIPIFREVNSIV